MAGTSPCSLAFAAFASLRIPLNLPCIIEVWPSARLEGESVSHMHSPGQQPPAPQPLPGVSNIIAVGSGKGGVGKTTLSVNLALALSKMGYKVGLLDADVYGPNVPLMLGTNAQPRAVSNERIEPILALGLKVISVGFLNPGDKPIIWRGPMLHQIIRQFLNSVEWGQLDYLVIDLPPGTGDVALSLVQTVPLTGAVVVSTPSDVSLQDGRKAIEMFRQMKVDLVGMVENMSYFVCPHCHHEVDIFSRGGAERTAQQFGVAFLGAIQLDPELRKGGDTGKPAVLDGENAPHAKSLYEFARRVVSRVDEIRAQSGDSVIQIQ
jgi:ATP-binding protein involved in chromosome partitioning